MCALSVALCVCSLGKKVEYYFTQKLPKTMAVKRKKDLMLECMLSDPRPNVTWYKNGEKIEVVFVCLRYDTLSKFTEFRNAAFYYVFDAVVHDS